MLEFLSLQGGGGFSQATITAVNPPQYWGAQVYLTWTSTSPPGTWFQIYLDRALSWFGQSTSARMPAPPSGINRIDIGTVPPGAEQKDFSSSLPATPRRRASLSWLGGTFEGTDIAGFRVYGSGAANGPVNYAAILADITAYPSGIYTDGFGLGGFGGGGFGESASTYTWISDSLTAGIWSYGVRPYDRAGNLGTAVAASVTIVGPPLMPADFGDGKCVHYTFNAGLETITLNWLASPG